MFDIFTRSSTPVPATSTPMGLTFSHDVNKMAATKYLSYEGLSYLWSLLKTKLGAKQDTIQDLEEIRSNASTGAGLKSKVDGVAEGAQVNVIETVKVNNAALTVTGKAVNVEVPTAATTAPLMDGTAAVGTSNNWAKADHVHPSDNTKVDKVEGKGLSTNDLTDALLAKINGVEEGGQVNEIESIKVNDTALSIANDKSVSIPNATTSVYGATILSSAVNSLGTPICLISSTHFWASSTVCCPAASLVLQS